MIEYGLFGSTKEGEYHRTIEMLTEMTGKSKKDVMRILYFLHDSQYDNKELKEIADLIYKTDK